ncbi:CatB-related O-acetyltransferase [Thetidibacter halocola]|uniref:CatB-related O-acetyltransferase n=1 Tax=Thetidibacter halocola TaxID=2827239 RepID=A0A8J8B5N7_9RHOB|nr:CatB-related O-acetyltransferase [Thetidibacter halocola]MBS0123136.1 CatB-related O-acetyltransferase [Thetidibacter halocola]
MPFSLPDATRVHPITLPDGTAHQGTVHLSAVIRHPRIEVGEFTYASDFDPPPPDGWAARLAPYLFDFSRERLTLGRFCQVAHGVRFITASANHDTRGISTYPFAVLDPETMASYQPDRRDTVIGHDVWLGHGAQVMPGARIGNGVIVGAGAVVRGTIPDYAVVAGNPSQRIRMRFTPDEIDMLNALAWWHWPPESIARARSALEQGDIAALKGLAP